MDKNAIQKYAIWARNELIGQVKQRAFQYGISDDGYGEENASVINGRVLTPAEKRQRQDFVHEIQQNSFEQAVEEVAYTWFNRFVALRFMEVNDYLPTHVRVFSDANGGFNPEILKDVLHLDLDGLNKTKVSELLNTNQTEELYRYLLLTQCNALNGALPEMFEKLGSYSEMLLPNNILKQDSVLAHLVKDIDEDDWKDAVQIIGWMYQYYNTEPKQAVFDGLKNNIKITKEKIPAATQLFTPDWIVRYMVENSLGRLWLETHPNPTLKANWKYYLDEAEQTPEVAESLRVLRAENLVKSPEDIRLIDPCMGSGHILVYAFDVLMQIYESEGYNPRDAAKLILDMNIYGLDIDRRAYQLAYFSLMMKARQYNRRIFTDGVRPQVYHPAGFPDGEEFGSLVNVGTLPPKPIEKTGQLSLGDTDCNTEFRVWNFKRLLAQKYDVVVTNPPYMGSGNMDTITTAYLMGKYPNSKFDFCTVFLERAASLTKLGGYTSLIILPVWMFLSSYQKMREELLLRQTIINMLHFGRGVFGSDFGSVAFILYNNTIAEFCGSYAKLFGAQGSVDTVEEKENLFFSRKLRFNIVQSAFMKIPGLPIAYWTTNNMIRCFTKGEPLGNICRPKIGQNTGDNERFLRLWFEVNFGNITFGLKQEQMMSDYYKWLPYNKGGSFRKWFGNQEYIINWEYNGKEVKDYAVVRNKGKHWSRYIQNIDSMCKAGVTWTFISSSKFGTRYLPTGFICDVNGSALYPSDDSTFSFLALLNTKLTFELLRIENSTMSFQACNIAGIPVINQIFDNKEIAKISMDNVLLSRADWDAFETSWNFIRHPLIRVNRTVEKAFAKWECEAAERFDMIKTNEEELNHIFIEIYGLQDELTPEVADKDVTVRRAELGREIRSLISYAVGCMLGRYSLDCEGLAYAGGDWDASKYSTFIPDKDNIIPICDDEYFEDDIVGRFVDFIRVAYGAETLEENLKFIADALGGKGTPREVIRSYFLNDFFADHCKIYQKRPIYWLFDSGKKNGFKALVYLHRYSRDLLAKMRTDYVHEQQERYRTQLSHIAAALNTATGAERAKLLKQQDKLAEQLKEITAFEEKVHHLADQNITIDLDDGVKKNYEIFADVLAKI